MLRRSDVAERLAAKALLEGLDGYDGLDLLPALCHRHHLADCRSMILRRADNYVALRREKPRA
jgi:hypothetical protein